MGLNGGMSLGTLAQDGFNTGEQMFSAEGLGDIVGGAAIESREAGELTGHSGQNNNWNGAGYGVTVKNFADGKAIQFREHQIQKNQVRKKRAGFLKRLDAL